MAQEQEIGPLLLNTPDEAQKEESQRADLQVLETLVSLQSENVVSWEIEARKLRPLIEAEESVILLTTLLHSEGVEAEITQGNQETVETLTMVKPTIPEVQREILEHNKASELQEANLRITQWSTDLH